ncbi:hypothetical protein [Brevibacterium sediminis]|uniref:hypothetical protein n=1 Tax=Brevibacterium sediminis TaxID=1857024 RepID=UPI001C6334FE|nr:hypothetical protein [Brevibacterium sediminis]
MGLFDSELRVIAAAEQLVSGLGSDDNHTVAAAAMDATVASTPASTSFTSPADPARNSS